jgi:hypothetical protein
MARPSPIENPEVRSKLIDALRAGATRRDAALYAGVSEATFHRWMQRAEADDAEQVESTHTAFREQVQRAEAEARVQAVFVIRRAMLTEWRAALEYLKRRAPHDWSDRVEVHTRGEVAVMHQQLSPDEMRRIAEELLEDE